MVIKVILATFKKIKKKNWFIWLYVTYGIEIIGLTQIKMIRYWDIVMVNYLLIFNITNYNKV